MGIVEIFSNNEKNAAAISIDTKNESMSLLAFLAQQPVDTITDVESTTKIMFSLLSDLFPDDFHENFLKILHNLKLKDIIFGAPFKIHVHDKFVFKLLLFLSLKYRKSVFSQAENSTAFLQTVLVEILSTIDIVKFHSLHLLRLLELILKKRDDVLTPELSLAILKSMNQAAHSPLTGFKNWAHNVSRIVLRSLPCDSKKRLCNLNNFPIKGIDLNDTLKYCEESEIRSCFQLINRQVLAFFCNNTDSREGSFLFQALAKICAFDEFVEEVWPYYNKPLREFDEGEFYQSFLKYWIPITVKHYTSDFYEFVRTTDVHYQIKVYTLLETRKRGFYKPEFDSDTLAFVKYSKTSSIGLKIVSTYVRKHEWPQKFEIKAVNLFLDLYSQNDFTEDVVKILKRFFSQMFLVCHINLNRDRQENILVCTNFLHSVYKFCLGRMSGSGNCEVAVQVIAVVWDVALGASSDLLTCYKIDRENTYGAEGNLFYQSLRTSGFWNKTFINQSLIKEMDDLVRKLKYCPKLLTLLKDRYLNSVNMDGFQDFVGLEMEIRSSVCLQSSEKIRVYTDLVMSHRMLAGSESNDIHALCQMFNDQIDCLDPDMFSCVLILDILITVCGHQDLDIVSLLDKGFDYLDHALDHNVVSKLNTKETKVLEGFINNLIEGLAISKPLWSKLDKERVFGQLIKVIEVSNMKRPVFLAANLVSQLGAAADNDVDKAVKVKLLDRTLYSLYYNRQGGKIRRCPETRLVIHALCLSDKDLTKPSLLTSLNFMLAVLNNPLSSDSTLSSTLHSLEVLVSDNSIHQLTLPFVVDIVKHCIRLFNQPSWIVRNADLQLLKSLIERLLGVSLDENVRPKTIEDVFVLFPPLISHFYDILSAKDLNDSSLMVLLFFSSSQIKNDFFVHETLDAPFEKFRSLFMTNICANKVGFLTVEAFAALCPNTHIPWIFSNIVGYIRRHFVTMSKNVFADLVRLLQRLQQKFEASVVQTGRKAIADTIRDLVTYLKPFDCFYFNLLSLKLFTVDEVVDKIGTMLSREMDCGTRVWLNNYLPFAVVRIHVDRLGEFLQELLSRPLPEFLQAKVLSILVDRSTEPGFPVAEILRVLLLKLPTLDDDFLITAYAKTVLLLFDLSGDLLLSDAVIAGIRQDFRTACIYKVFVYVAALAHCDCKCAGDKLFASRCVQNYVDSVQDDEVMLDLATTMTDLYKIVSIQERYTVIKLSFYLLLNEFTSFETCKFVSWLTGSQSSSVLISLVNLLSHAKLSRYLGDKRLTCKLLLECYRYVDDLPEDLEESDTYYVIESDCSVSKHDVKAVILKSLQECHHI